MATGAAWLLEQYGYWSGMATGAVWLLERYGYWSSMATAANFSKLQKNRFKSPWSSTTEELVISAFCFSVRQICVFLSTDTLYKLTQSLTNTSHRG